jgi:hypothetical protein
MAVGTVPRLPPFSYCLGCSSPSGVPATGTGSGGGRVPEQAFQRPYVVENLAIEVDSRFNSLRSAEVCSNDISTLRGSLALAGRG